MDGSAGLGLVGDSTLAPSPLPHVHAYGQPQRVPFPVQREPPPEPPKRIRLVSFGRDRSRPHRHKEKERDRERERERDDYERRRAHGHHAHPSAAGLLDTTDGGGGGRSGAGDALLHDDERHGRSSEVRAITPTLTYCSTAPSISLDSVPSSIDPEGKLTPAEREVAVLRARASLADSERRRFKEERKWAMSQGNTARASQLSWQVKRYTALMESFHREADAKVVEGMSLDLNIFRSLYVHPLIRR